VPDLAGSGALEMQNQGNASLVGSQAFCRRPRSSSLRCALPCHPNAWVLNEPTCCLVRRASWPSDDRHRLASHSLADLGHTGGL
jgi:hypothetical protein